MVDYLYLQLQNPWWENKDEINEDERLKEFDRLPYQFLPQALLSLDLKPGNIHLITGPRQTGKSTGLKLYLRRLLQENRPARSILYFNCNALTSKKELIDLVIEFNRTAEKQITQIFLDEVSSVPDWPQGIKWLADTGLLKKTTLFLTGSSSINLKKSGEFLPGRRGSGKDLALLPLGFFDYLNLKGEKLEPFKITPQFFSRLHPLAEKARRDYHRFLLTGGFLRNINYGLSETTNDLYLKTLKSELFKNGKKEASLREVIRKIMASLSSQTSYTNIAEEAELGSKNTAIEYLNFLADSFFLKEVKCYDLQTKKVILKRNKKFYTLDPYLLWLFEGFVNGSLNFSLFPSLLDPAKIAENFVASELEKKGEKFFFFQNTKELDFYLPDKNLGIEVKYKNKIVSQDLFFPPAVNQKILVSKETLEKRGEVLIIPVYLFPLLEF